MERLKKYSIGVLSAFSAFVLLLSLLSLIFLNSGMLDRLVKNRLISLFNNEFFGRMELQEVHLKFPNQVTLINPRIYGPGENIPALDARTVSLRFNFLTILQPEIKKLYLRRLVADSLHARAIEQENGKLNLELIFTSRDPDSRDLQLEHFFCKTLKINNSSLSWSGKRTGSVLGLNNFDLELSAFTVRKKLLTGTLENLRFNIPQHRFSLRQASGTFLFSETRSEVLALKAASNKSSAELSATVDNFNIFSGNAEKMHVPGSSFLNIQKLALHSDDLKIFSSALVLPRGIYTFKGNARGKEDNVEILDALLSHDKSRIAMKGELLDLKSRKALAFSLECDSSTISAPFVESLLKDISQKKIARKTGDITFLGHAQGNLKEIKTDLSLFSTLGDASLNAEASGNGSDQLECKGTFTLTDFEPHLLMEQGSRKSLVNASGSFEGNADIRKINRLKLEMKLADSFWQDQTVKEGSISVNYYSSLLKSVVFLKNELSSFNLDSEIDWKEVTPRYRATGKTARVDISKILASKEFSTDLNGIFALQGSGFDPGMLNAAAVFQFSPSTINGFELKDRSKVSAEIVQTARSSRLNINSDFLDLLAEGDYTLAELIDLGKLAGSGISREITSQNIWHSYLSAPLPPTDALKKPFTVNYRITVRDISPLVLLFPVQGITLQGSTEGRAAYLNGQCSIASSMTLARLQSRNDFLFENLSMETTAECNVSGTRKASITGRASAFTLGGNKAGNALFSARYSPSHLEGTIDIATPDAAQSLSSAFSAAKNGTSYDLLLNHLRLKDNTGIWQAAAESRIILGRTSARYNHFTIAKGIQQVVLDGELSNSQPGTFQCTLSTVELNELKRFALDPSIERLSGTINASLSVSGSPGSKTSSIKINGNNIRYDKITIGNLQGNALHSGNLLRFDLHSRIPVENSVAGTASMNTIDGSGTIPLRLSYFPLHFGMADQQPISASFRSDNLSAQFLEYLVPFIESAEGIIPTTLRIEGRTPKPDIFLNSSLRDTKIKIEPTSVSYLCNGEIYVTPRALELRDITLGDYLKGTGRINGMMKLEKLEPTELALGGRFDRLLLFNKKDKQDETSFGTITGTTGNILLHGTVSAPVIEGELRINDADFSIYRTGSNESTKYIGVNKFIEFVPRFPSKSVPGIDNNEKPVKQAEFYHSLLDILQIKDLKLSNIEPLKCSVIFDRLRGEQLETSINNLSLNVSKTNQRYRLFGSVNVIGGKYKFSNSNFDLQDGGKITWNNVEIRDGVMDHLYGSKNVSTSNQQTGERDNVRLLIAITGTLNEPQVAMGYYLNEQSQPYASVNVIGGQSSQIDPNAELNVISMLFSRQWYVRPGRSGQTANSAVSNVGISAGTGLLSSRISKIIQDIGLLESFNVNMGVDKRGALSGLDLYFALSVPGTNGKVRFIGTGSPGIGESALSDYYGTAQKIEYRITPKVFLEASRSYGQSGTTTSSTNLQKPSETWGVSLSYKERFHTWDQFWKRIIPSSDKKK